MAEQAGQVAPLLSITVLNYNYARYLGCCLDSILRQTMRDFELIVINDCSTDNSLEVIEPFLSDPRVRLVNHCENQGFVASLLEGVALSRGAYISVMSADDYCLSPQAFTVLMRQLQSDNEVVLAYSAYGQYTDNGTRKYLRRPHDRSYVRSGVDEFRELVLDPYILHSGAIIRASAYHAVGGYDPNSRYAVDIKMWLLLCSKGKVAYSADELYAYRMHDSNMSHSGAAIRTSLVETVGGLRTGFAAQEYSGDDMKTLYERALKCALVAIPTDDIFAGRLGRGWYGYWCAMRMYPLHTVFQTRTLILIARTLLGDHFFRRLRSIMRGQRHKSASTS